MIDIDHDAIGVQVRQDWQDADVMQQCRDLTGTACAVSSFGIGAGVGPAVEGFSSLQSAVNELSSTMRAGLNELYEAFVVLGSNDTTVGDNYNEVDALNARFFQLLGPRAPQIN
ncbi:MAG: hypothetical protein Q4B08_04835 [Propionibacteriaceae bacterium]|nr:hypothetical protein [Propionibacteriaceae bacterium]